MKSTSKVLSVFFSAFILILISSLQSCNQDLTESHEVLKDEQADITLKSVNFDLLQALRGKRIAGNEVRSAAQLTFDVKGTEEKANVAILNSVNQNIEQGVILDENLNSKLIIEVHKKGEDSFETNYYNPEGDLMLTTEGDGEEMRITFLNESSPDARQMVTFMGCLKKLWADDTFKVVALAGTIGGYGAYVAAGAVIGCGIASW